MFQPSLARLKVRPPVLLTFLPFPNDRSEVNNSPPFAWEVGTVGCGWLCFQKFLLANVCKWIIVAAVGVRLCERVSTYEHFSRQKINAAVTGSSRASHIAALR